MRITILAFALIFYASSLAGDDRSNAKYAELHDVALSYFATIDVLGSNHPKAAQLRTELELRLKDGESLDPVKLNTRLTEFYREHQRLIASCGMHHPRVQNNLRQLSIASRLMTIDASYLAKNLDQLGMNTDR